jgi:hypothetical protein
MSELVFKTRDHPEANGKEAQKGDVQYDLYFPLEDGTKLHVLMGREGMKHVQTVVLEELADDELVTGN